jgi:hypothetical protein
MKSLPAFCAILLLSHCAPPLPGRHDGIDPNPFRVLEKQAGPEHRDPSRRKVPLLVSRDAERSWGRPRMLVGPKGGFGLHYQDPRDPASHLTVFGTRERYPAAGPIPPPYTELRYDRETGTIAPRERMQRWNQAGIAGKKVRFSIAERQDSQPVQYATETFRLPTPEGGSASYMVRVASTKGAAEARRLLESLTTE